MIHYEMPAVMMSHVVYSQCDSLPASFSAYWISQVLRKEIGFQGAVFSDDLTMKATEIIGDYTERARLALEAGCDMVLICNNPGGRDSVLGKLSDLSSPVSHLRLARMHGKQQMDMQTLRSSERWKRVQEILKEIDPEPFLEI
jgi:beta-N-acetylhexosaminidase